MLPNFFKKFWYLFRWHARNDRISPRVMKSLSDLLWMWIFIPSRGHPLIWRSLVINRRRPSLSSFSCLPHHSNSYMAFSLRWWSHTIVDALIRSCAVQIILTHEHADAVLGLDDVWMVQPKGCSNDFRRVPIFLTQFTMDRSLYHN